VGIGVTITDLPLLDCHSPYDDLKNKLARSFKGKIFGVRFCRFEKVKTLKNTKVKRININKVKVQMTIFKFNLN